MEGATFATVGPPPPLTVRGVAGEAIAAPMSGGIDNGPSADGASSYPTGKDSDRSADEDDDRSADEQDGTHAKGTMTLVGSPAPQGGRPRDGWRCILPPAASRRMANVRHREAASRRTAEESDGGQRRLSWLLSACSCEPDVGSPGNGSIAPGDGTRPPDVR